MPPERRHQWSAGSVNLLLGERERSSTSDLAARTPIIGASKIPKELIHSSAPIYAVSSTETEPTIMIREIGSQAGRRLWQVEIAEEKEQNKNKKHLGRRKSEKYTNTTQAPH